MQDQSDVQLLRDYAQDGHEAAFRELVNRHTDLVYSAALRQVNSPDLAGDIAQSVFTDLARKARPMAGQMPEGISLAGWLHRATRYASLNHLRDVRRRLTNERQAMEQLLTDSESGPAWEQIRPVLDEALDSLGDGDREALLLRYFKNQDFRAIGQALGVSDDTAQKRVSRAVERLREFFSKRNVTIGASGLAVLISANAVQSAPAGLAAAISAAALLAGTAVTTSTTAIAVTKTIVVMTALQKALITVTVAALAGTGIYEARQVALLRQQNQTLLQQQSAQIQESQHKRDEATNRLAQLLAEPSRLKSNNDSTELLKLRGELGVMRQQKSDLEQLVFSLRAVAGKNQPEFPTNPIPRASWGFAGYDTPEAAIQSILWAKSSGNEQTWYSGLRTNMVGWLTNYVKGNSEEERTQFLMKQTKDWSGLRILREIPMDNDTMLMQLELNSQADGKTDNHISVEEMRRIDGQWRCVNEYN